jgi:hypothetical protein
MAEPTGLTDIEGQEIDSNWDEVKIPFFFGFILIF